MMLTLFRMPRKTLPEAPEKASEGSGSLFRNCRKDISKLPKRHSEAIEKRSRTCGNNITASFSDVVLFGIIFV